MAPTAHGFVCEFVAGSRHCAHSGEQLFSSAYQRTNRTNRTKIVRCFPHCCPRHVPRSYCGSPMQLRVKAKSTSSDDDEAFALSDLQVFSRFRPADTTAMTTGMRIKAATIKANVQSERSTTAEWIVSRVVQTPFQGSDGWLFELNPNGRWFYAWDSGATKARRQMRHLLETVVLRPCDGGKSFDVVATVCSQSFTFVSFRRAADAELRDSEPSLLYRDLSLQLQEQQYLPPTSNRQLDDIGTRKRLRPRDDEEALAIAVPNWMNPSSGDESFSFSPPKKRMFSPHALPLREQSDVSAFLSCVFGIVDQLPAPQLPLDLVLRGTLNSSTKDARHRRHAKKCSLVSCLDAAIRLVWRLRTSRRVALVSAQYSSWAVNALLDQDALWLAYWQLMQVINHHIERILGEYGWSSDGLARALATVSADPVEQRAQVENHEYDWGSFVANVRQHHVFQHRIGRMTRTAQLTVFRGEWSCSLEEVELNLEDDGMPQRHSGRESLSQLLAGSVFFFWTQLSRLSIDTSQLAQARQLSITSALHRHVLTQPITFLLDGTFRQFDTLPHGESTLSARLPGGYKTGDYSGHVCPHSGRVYITTFVWPSGGNVDDPAYRWHWTMRPDQRSKSFDVFVRVDVGSLAHASVSVPLETLSIQDKLRRIQSWRPFAHAVLPYHASDSRNQASRTSKSPYY